VLLSGSDFRPCYYLAPQYTKLARTHVDAGEDIVFGKSNASVEIGEKSFQNLLLTWTLFQPFDSSG